MASQVLSGTGNVSYTNNTGQNVRVVINYMKIDNSSNLNPNTITVSWGNVSLIIQSHGGSIGRSIAGTTLIQTGNTSGTIDAFGQNYTSTFGDKGETEGIPLELMLAPNETFSIIGTDAATAENPLSVSQLTIGAYNMVIIPEAG